MTKNSFTRRRFIIGSTLGISALALTSCDALEQNADVGAWSVRVPVDRHV
jgi:hypothetical protein